MNRNILNSLLLINYNNWIKFLSILFNFLGKKGIKTILKLWLKKLENIYKIYQQYNIIDFIKYLNLLQIISFQFSVKYRIL